MKTIKHFKIKQISLRTKLFLVFGGLSSLVILALTMMRMFGTPLTSDDGAIRRIRMQALQQIEIVADYKQSMLENWLVERQLVLKRLSQNSSTQSLLIRCLYGDESSPTALPNTADWDPADFKTFSERLQFFVNNTRRVENVIFANAITGKIIAASRPIIDGETIDKELSDEALKQPRYAKVDIRHTQDHRNCKVVFSLAVPDPISTKPVGILIAKYKITEFLQPLLHHVRGLGETGELVLVDQQGTLLSHLKFPLKSGEQGIIHQTKITAQPAVLAAAGSDSLLHESTDYRGEPVIAASRRIKINDAYQWGLVIKQDRDEALQLLLNRVYSTVSVGFASLVFVLLGVFIISRQLTQPFKQLSETADRVRAGDLTARSKARSTIEESNLSDVFNSMVDRLAGWQETLSSEVALKTAELDQAYLSLQQTELQRSSLAEISDFYLRNGTLKPTIELLIQQLLHFTGATVGRYRGCELSGDGSLLLNYISEAIFAPEDAQNPMDSTIKDAIKNCALATESTYNPVLADILIKGEVHILGDEHLNAIKKIPIVDGKPVIDSVMVVPVTKGDTIYGLITLINKPGGFNNKDKEVITGFAATAALIVNADRRERASIVAEESAKIKGQFLANMSHELRTPMNVVIGMSNLLLNTQMNATQQDYLQKIGNSSRQLLALINDILDSSKLESGHQLTLNPTIFEPEQIFLNIINLHSYNIDEQQVELHVDIDRSVPLSLKGDSQRLEQILNNLLGNAIKFTEHGNIILAVKVVQQDSTKVVLQFCVSDTGRGIESSQQEQMFQPFIQADSSNTRQQGGTGLGLTISRQLCRLMGGDLTVESNLNEGSTFHFSLPFEVIVADTKMDHALLERVELQGMHVLIVESNHISQRILEQILSHMHFRVQLVSTSKQALIATTKAEENDDPIRLVIFDSMLQDMSGTDFAHLLTQQHLSSVPKTIMMTPRKQLSQSQDDAEEISALVTKPAQPSPIFEAIMQIFGAGTTTMTSENATSINWKETVVLLVEDNALNRQVARGLLEKVGITVEEAINGAVAVEMVKENTYDMVLMDVQMPIMDGLEAARTIRKLNKAQIKQLPILAMTANAFTKDHDASINAGMNAHIVKPVDPITLYNELNRWLPQHKQVSVTSQSESPWVLLPATLPGVDISIGLRYADGDQQRYYRLLNNFVAHFAETEPLLRDELKTNSFTQAAHRIHNLKAIAGTLGAIQLQDIASQVENQLRKEEEPEALDKLLQLFNPLLLACAALPMLDDNAHSDLTQENYGTVEELQHIFLLLTPALEKHHAQVCKKLSAELANKIWPDKHLSELEQLQSFISSYHYLEALELLKTIQL